MIDQTNAAGDAERQHVELDPARRKALFEQMLGLWEIEAPGTVLHQPLET